MTISNQELPFVIRILELIEVECNQIVEKEAFDLSTEDVYPRAQDVQCMTVTSRRPCARRDSARPLSGSWNVG